MTNTETYCDLRRGYDMVVPSDATLAGFRPSIDKVSAADITLTFHAIVKRIRAKGERLDRFDTRLSWWALKAEIEQTGHATKHMKCGKCGGVFQIAISHGGSGYNPTREWCRDRDCGGIMVPCQKEHTR